MAEMKTYLLMAILSIPSNVQNEVIAKFCKSTQGYVTVRTPLPNIKITGVQISKFINLYTINYNVYPCGGIIGGETGTLNSPEYPNKPSVNFECSWVLTLPVGQVIKLSAVSVNLGSDCEKSYINIYNGKLPSYPKLLTVCQDHFPEFVLSQSNALWIDYKAEKDSEGTGFSFKYEPVIDGCGGTFHDRSRIIQSPKYPKNYPNNAECTWEIRADEGYFITLKFLSRFQLEQSNGCLNDFVEIWDWKNATWMSLGKKCGRVIDEVFNSTSNRMRVMFRSNDDITGYGFKAQWFWDCGGSFMADSVERFIVSPGYPEMYGRGMTCHYNITAGPAKYINIKFYDFNLERGLPDCKFDNLTISNVLTRTRYNRHLQQVYCGTNLPPEIRLSNVIYMTFSTDYYVQRPGFKLSYQLESCGGIIDTPQLISSPSLNITWRPGIYHGLVTCTWNITAPLKRIVAIKFLKFNLPIRHNCYFDNVDIFEGLNVQQATRIANLCGDLTDNLPVIKSRSNQALLRLRTDRTNKYDGFNAIVYFPHGPAEGCGGMWNITRETNFESPKLDDMDCSWTVYAPPGYSIKIKFTELNLPSTCSDDNLNGTFIEIKDGNSLVSETMEKLCGIVTTSFARELVTSGRTALIRLFTSGVNNNAFKLTLIPQPSLCGPAILNASAEAQYLTSPNYPGTYPSNIKCSWIIKSASSSRLVIHFEDFDLVEKRNDHVVNNTCGEDKLRIIDDPNNLVLSDGLGPNTVITGSRRANGEFTAYNMVPGVHQFCGKNELPFDYYSNKELITVTFSSSGESNTHGKGFKLVYQTIGCNRNFTSNQGRIVNHRISDCNVTITVEEGATISLFFQYFLLYQSNNCDDIGLEIHDGADHSAKTLLRACGYALPEPVFSTKNQLWLHSWNKRASMYAANYDIVYTSSSSGRGCGGTLYNYKGRFTSPLYPNEYKEDAECNWYLKVPLGMRLGLKFNVFDIRGECKDNHVTVVTYETGKDEGLKHKFCPQDVPAILYSTARAEVQYKSSPENEGRGWQAVFEAVSGG